MLNTRVSINKAFAAVGLGIQLLLDDYENMPPGAGPYPSVAVRVISATPPPDAHFGLQTPITPSGATRQTLVLEAEVRTNSPSWNQALVYAGQLQAAFDKKTKVRQTWLSPDGSVNPAPVVAGEIRFNRAILTTLQDEKQVTYKSAFLTWEAKVEVPAP